MSEPPVAAASAVSSSAGVPVSSGLASPVVSGEGGAVGEGGSVGVGAGESDGPVGESDGDADTAAAAVPSGGGVLPQPLAATDTRTAAAHTG
ncbi:hypothetical protein [Kitasatospora paranensis]|uniref:Uncharacterized protein n=1 Tax=Kitasatospora paranensis TaxID=258053 RepID=A0ABW2FP17_9ACTN